MEWDFTVSLDLPLMPPVLVEIGSNYHLRHSGKAENGSARPVTLLIPQPTGCTQQFSPPLVKATKISCCLDPAPLQPRICDLMKEHPQVMPTVTDMWVFLRNSTKVLWCFTFPSLLRPCGIDFKTAGGSPSKALQLLWSNHHWVWEEHSEGTIMDTNPVLPWQACPLSPTLNCHWNSHFFYHLSQKPSTMKSLLSELFIWTEMSPLCLQPTPPASLQSLP